MSLSESYREYIVEKLMLQYLYDGEVPTADQIETDLQAYQLVHQDLSLPLSKYIDFSVERGSSSSADKIESIVNTISSDMVAITKEIYNLANLNNNYYERWQAEINRLKSKAKRYENRVDSLQLLTNNTEGYFATVEDNFVDMNYIDKDNTTAMIDVIEQKVTLNSGSELGSITQYNTNDLTANDISFYALNRDVATRYYNTSTDNSLVQMLKTEKSSWVGKIISANSGSMTAELKIHLSNTDIELSKITIEAYSTNTSSNSTITAQYSTDGYNWFIIPSEATKSFTNTVSWSFSPVNVKWVKFIIYKPSYDSGQYEYLYSIQSIRFYNNSYYETRGNMFYSSSLSREDINNNKIGFFKAELNTCEYTPEDTSITYALSASKDNSTWTDWHYIIPFKNTSTSYPKVVNFTGINKVDNNDFDELNSNYNSQQVITSIDDSDSEYRFTQSQVALINTKIEVPGTIDTNILSNTIEVWRNIRVTDSYPDTYTVRDVARGWSLSGQSYICYFEVVSSAGKIVDFGDRECIIDGQKFKGITNIPKGIHKFETLNSNWYDISSYISEVPISEEYLKSIDKLYPYNHKLIIEGIPYPISFEGEKIYLGMDISAESYCIRVSLFDIYNNDTGFGSFAIKDIGINNSILGIFVKYDANNIDYTNEYNLVKWKTSDNITEPYKYIKIRAELSSDNTNITPEITGYRIKLGA